MSCGHVDRVSCLDPSPPCQQVQGLPRGGSPRKLRAWPLAWPSPSGPLGRQRLQRALMPRDGAKRRGPAMTLAVPRDQAEAVNSAS